MHAEQIDGSDIPDSSGDSPGFSFTFFDQLDDTSKAILEVIFSEDFEDRFDNVFGNTLRRSKGENRRDEDRLDGPSGPPPTIICLDDDSNYEGTVDYETDLIWEMVNEELEYYEKRGRDRRGRGAYKGWGKPPYIACSDEYNELRKEVEREVADNNNDGLMPGDVLNRTRDRRHLLRNGDMPMVERFPNPWRAMPVSPERLRAGSLEHWGKRGISVDGLQAKTPEQMEKAIDVLRGRVLHVMHIGTSNQIEEELRQIRQFLGDKKFNKFIESCDTTFPSSIRFSALPNKSYVQLMKIVEVLLASQGATIDDVFLVSEGDTVGRIDSFGKSLKKNKGKNFELSDKDIKLREKEWRQIPPTIRCGLNERKWKKNWAKRRRKQLARETAGTRMVFIRYDEEACGESVSECLKSIPLVYELIVGRKKGDLFPLCEWIVKQGIFEDDQQMCEAQRKLVDAFKDLPMKKKGKALRSMIRDDSDILLLLSRYYSLWKNRVRSRQKPEKRLLRVPPHWQVAS